MAREKRPAHLKGKKLYKRCSAEEAFAGQAKYKMFRQHPGETTERANLRPVYESELVSLRRTWGRVGVTLRFEAWAGNEGL